MYVWSLVNQKGGTGKTTTAIHSSAALAARGKRVVLIDLDPQGHATLGLGCAVEGRATLADVLAERCSLREATVVAAGGVHLVPAHADLAEFEERAEHILGPERLLSRALAQLEPRYDYALLDCPPRADGVLSINALRACDAALLVVETSVFALQGALRALDLLDEFAASSLDRELDVRLVATMYDRRTRLAREILAAMQARFGARLFDSVIRRSVHLREAVAYGVPLQQLDPRSAAVGDFESLAGELIQASSQAPSTTHRARDADAVPLTGPRSLSTSSPEESLPWSP